MSGNADNLRCVLCILGLFLAIVGANGQTNSIQPEQMSVQPEQTAADVETDLSTNTTSSTCRLIATREGLNSIDLRYEDNLVQVTEAERLAGPPMYNEFVQITNELAKRGGESVWQSFEKVLIDDKLIDDDKELVRNCLRNKISGCAG